MDLGSIFLILSLLILVGLFISRPLFERNVASAANVDNLQDHELSGLLAERDRILNALQELDFDHALGKIPEEDYPSQRAVLLQRGADVLRRLDTFQKEASSADAEARLEAAVAARRADARRNDTRRKAGVSPDTFAQSDYLQAQAPIEVDTPDDELEVKLANRRRARQEKAIGFCPQCGGPLQKSDRFCPKCGTTLE